MVGISNFDVNSLQNALECTWTADVEGNRIQSIKLYYTDIGTNVWNTYNVPITSTGIAIINDLVQDTEYKVYLVIYTTGQIYTSETKYAQPGGLIKRPTFTHHTGDGHIQLNFNNLIDGSSNLISSDLSNNSSFDGGSAITNILVSINKIDETGVGMKVLNCLVSGSSSTDDIFFFNSVHFYNGGILIIPNLTNDSEYEVAVTYVNEFGPSEISETIQITPSKLPESIKAVALNGRHIVSGKLEVWDYPSVVVYWETPEEAHDDGYEDILAISKYHVYKQIEDGSFNMLCDVNFSENRTFDISGSNIADLSYNLITNVQLNVQDGQHISIDNCNRLVDLDVSAGTHYTYRVVSENKFGSKNDANDSNQILALMKPSKINLNITDLSFNNEPNYFFNLKPLNDSFTDNFNGYGPDKITSLKIKYKINGEEQDPVDISFNDLTNLSALISGFQPKNKVEIKLSAVFSHNTLIGSFNLLSGTGNNSSVTERRMFALTVEDSSTVVESSTIESDTITYTFHGPLDKPATLVSTNVDDANEPTPDKMKLTWPLITDTNGPDLSANLIYYELTITDLSLNTQKVKYLLSDELDLDLSANNLQLFRPDCLTALPTDLSYNTILNNLPYYVSDSSSAYTKFHSDASNNGYVDISCNLGSNYSYSIKAQYYNTDDNIYVLSTATDTSYNLTSFDLPSAPTISNFTALVEEITVYKILNTDQTIYSDASNGTVVSGTPYGWGFSNPNNNGSKINWYYFNKQTYNKSIKVNDLTNMYCVITQFNIENPFNPFFVLYTTPKSSGNATGWYHSKLFYGSNDLPTNVDKSKPILLYTGTDDNSVHPEILPSNRQQLQLNSSLCNPTTITDAVVSNSTDEINLISLQTSSNPVAYNKYDFICSEMGLKSSVYNQKSICITSGPAGKANNGNNVTFQLDASNNNTGFSDALIKFRGEIWKNGSSIYTQDLTAGTTNTINSYNLSGVSVGDLLTLQVVAHLDDVEYISTGQTDEFDSVASNTFDYHYFEQLSAPTNVVATNVDTDGSPTPGFMKLTWDAVSIINSWPINDIEYLLTVRENGNAIVNNLNIGSSTQYTYNGCTLGNSYTYELKAQYVNGDFETNITSVATSAGDALVSFDKPSAPTISIFTAANDGSSITFTLTPGANTTGFSDSLIKFRGEIWKNESSIYTQELSASIYTNTIYSNNLSNVSVGDLLELIVVAYLDGVEYISTGATTEFDSPTSNIFRYHYFEQLAAVNTLTAINVDSNNIPTPNSMKLTWPLVQSTNGPTATIYYLLTVTEADDTNGTNSSNIISNFVLNTSNYSMISSNASYTFNGCTLGHSYRYTIKAQYYNDDFNTPIYSDNTLTQNALVSFDLPKTPIITEFEVEVDGSQLSFTLTPETNSTGFPDSSISFRANLSNGTPFSVTSGRNVIPNTQDIVNKGATINLRVTAYLASVIYNSDSTNNAKEFVNDSDVLSNVRYSYRPHIKNININGAGVTILVEPNGDGLVQIAYLAIDSNNNINTQFMQDIDNTNTLNSRVSYDSTSLDGTITLSFSQNINSISISVGNNHGFDFQTFPSPVPEGM